MHHIDRGILYRFISFIEVAAVNLEGSNPNLNYVSQDQNAERRRKEEEEKRWDMVDA
jgi:hypothetical protein